MSKGLTFDFECSNGWHYISLKISMFCIRSALRVIRNRSQKEIPILTGIEFYIILFTFLIKCNKLTPVHIKIYLAFIINNRRYCIRALYKYHYENSKSEFSFSRFHFKVFQREQSKGKMTTQVRFVS